LSKGIIYQIESLTIDCISHETFYDGNQVYLTQTEQNLIEYLAKKNSFVTQRELQEAMYYQAPIRVHIHHIRRKIAEISGGKDYINNKKSLGYKLQSPDIIKKEKDYESKRLNKPT
jgi:DNA-binding response OmpR family regulator